MEIFFDKGSFFDVKKCFSEYNTHTDLRHETFFKFYSIYKKNLLFHDFRTRTMRMVAIKETKRIKIGGGSLSNSGFDNSLRLLSLFNNSSNFVIVTN